MPWSPRVWRMYGSMRRNFHWPYMADIVYATVSDRQSCGRNRDRKRRKHKLRVSSGTGPVDMVTIDIFMRLQRTKSGNKFIFRMTDRFSKLVKGTLTITGTETTVTTIFINKRMRTTEYNPRSWPTTVCNLRANCFSRFAKSQGCSRWQLRSATSRTNGNVERFNSTIVSRLRQYFAENKQDWNSCVVPPTYAYETQVRLATKLPHLVSFSLGNRLAL